MDLGIGEAVDSINCQSPKNLLGLSGYFVQVPRACRISSKTKPQKLHASLVWTWHQRMPKGVVLSSFEAFVMHCYIGLYGSYFGIIEKKMEITIMGLHCLYSGAA